MTSTQQRAELHRQIWQIANEVRGSVDGWDFKQYVLGTLFYRFISENFASYIEGDDDSVNYAVLSDEVINADIKDDAIKTKGYFIYPSQLFASIAAGAHRNENLNTDLAAIFKVNRPGYIGGRLFKLGRLAQQIKIIIILLFTLKRRHISNRTMQTSLIEPIHPFKSRELDIITAFQFSFK